MRVVRPDELVRLRARDASVTGAERVPLAERIGRWIERALRLARRVGRRLRERLGQPVSGRSPESR